MVFRRSERYAVSDIAEKLLAAIEALEQLTQADGYASWHIVNCGYDQIEFGSSCACAVPAAIQGHCAADREIVAEHGQLYVGGCTTCITPEWGYPTHGGSRPADWPCKTITATARRYGVTP